MIPYCRMEQLPQAILIEIRLLLVTVTPPNSDLHLVTRIRFVTFSSNKSSSPISWAIHVNGNMDPEDENEDLLADFIDEDNQFSSRISKPMHSRNHYSHSNNDEMMQQTGSSLCLLRLMDKYAR